MTRETKIGLLVGLAFIIVIGILLSDHFTSSMNPPINPKNDPLKSVMEGQGTGRSYASNGQQPVEVPRGTPRSEVPFPPRQDEGRVRVDGPNPPRDGRGNGGETIPPVPDDHHNEPTPPANSPRGPEVVPPTVKANIEHVAVEGDTVWKIARKYYGSHVSAADIARIVNANDSLKNNRNKVVVGNSYIIPPAEAQTNTDAPDNGTVDRTPPRVIPPIHESGNEDHTDAPPASATATVYTTKPGDSLWKIAYEQCGSGSKAVLDQIRLLNKDVLRNGDNIHPQMKLKLPPKTVASAN